MHSKPRDLLKFGTQACVATVSERKEGWTQESSREAERERREKKGNEREARQRRTQAAMGESEISKPMRQ